jgi:hypothetical protein
MILRLARDRPHFSVLCAQCYRTPAVTSWIHVSYFLLCNKPPPLHFLNKTALRNINKTTMGHDLLEILTHLDHRQYGSLRMKNKLNLSN